MPARSWHSRSGLPTTMSWPHSPGRPKQSTPSPRMSRSKSRSLSSFWTSTGPRRPRDSVPPPQPSSRRSMYQPCSYTDQSQPSVTGPVTACVTLPPTSRTRRCMRFPRPATSSGCGRVRITRDDANRTPMANALIGWGSVVVFGRLLWGARQAKRETREMRRAIRHPWARPSPGPPPRARAAPPLLSRRGLQ